MKDKIIMFLNDTFQFAIGSLITIAPLLELAILIYALIVNNAYIVLAVFINHSVFGLFKKSLNSYQQIKGAIIWKLYKE